MSKRRNRRRFGGGGRAGSRRTTRAEETAAALRIALIIGEIVSFVVEQVTGRNPWGSL
jgi:hypothetical protein